MRTIKNLWILFMFCHVSHAQTLSRQLINTASNKGTIGTNVFEWSVGEPMIQMYSTATLIITQGFLQPENQISTGISKNMILADELNLFPNPSSDQLFIQSNFSAPGTITFQLFDINGKEILSDKSNVNNSSLQKIDVSSLSDATYFLQVIYSNNQDEMKTSSYKIQKISNH